MEPEYTNIGRTENEDPSLPLFHGVKYALDTKLNNTLTQEIKQILDSQGAIEYQNSTLVISNNPNMDPSDKVPVKKFLSGVVLGAIGLSQNQVQLMFSEVHKYGGQIRVDVTNDVTHVLCTTNTNQNVPDNNSTRFVMTEWLDQCLNLKYRLDEEIYQFPDPTFNETIKIYNHPSDLTLSSIKRMKSKTLKGNVILLASDIDYPTENSVSIVITKYRTSDECILGWRSNKIVGSLWWLTNTILREKLESPLSSLLDYPVPKNGIIGMDSMRIAVSGYNKTNLQFLKTLIQHSGGIYDVDMSKSCTHLISGKSTEFRYEETTNRGLIVVNQLWLEESYQQWKVLPANNSRYKYIPDDSFLSNITAKSPLAKSKMKSWLDKKTIPISMKEKKNYSLKKTKK